MKPTIIYRDEVLLVVDKPAGLVVHRAKGYDGDTLADLLAGEINPEGFDADRPGVVHRLDKDTSGLMLVARDIVTGKYLMGQFKDRKVIKKYQALVYGDLAGSGRIDLPIGRSPMNPTRMSVYSPKAKDSITEYRAISHYAGFTLVELILLTGRTHQIRAHLTAIGHPIVGDPEYSRTRQSIKNLPILSRQFLHSCYLEFTHPDGRRLKFESKLPEELSEYLMALK